MVDQNYIKVNTPDVIFDIFDDEIILINMESGTYYSISNIAAKIWEQIGDGNFLQDIFVGVNSVIEGDSKEIEQATNNFLEELLAENLIKYSENESIIESTISENNTDSGKRKQKIIFEKPVMKQFTDMQDLLLLDPIHEVDESGWPNPLTDKPE